MLSIQTNVNSMNAQENLRGTNMFQARTIARLTSGYRINESGDDAAGLAVANKYRSDIAEIQQGVRNANDGLSTLQIIDGGLSNISKMLDRLKTLATQSASDGFEGDRVTLNREYQDLLSEIDRQASNIGLSSQAGSASRYNKDLNVYIGGGGDYAGNSGVEVKLGEDSDRVTSTALGITSTDILGGAGVEVGTANTHSLDTNLNANQTFTFHIEGEDVAVTVTGASNISVTEAVDQINDKIGDKGVQATIVDGELKFFSDKSFRVSVGTGGAGALTDNGAAVNVVNTGLNYHNTGTWTVPTSGNNAQYVVTFEDGTSKAVTIANNSSVADTVDDLNTGLKSLGLTAITNFAGDGFYIMSEKSFSLTYDADVDGGAAAAAQTVNAATASDDTANAEAAIAAINEAVNRLGIVQGKVGTAQNKISYAIQLAQSQITNFSAAESRIRDADVASEAANLTKAQVLQQASLAALAQANSAPQAVLSLLRG